MVAMVVATLLHVVMSMLFVRVFGMGIESLAITSSIKDGVLLLTVKIYSMCSTEIRKVLAPIKAESFRGWCQYLKVSLPSTAMICAEWWAYEILIVLAGTIGVAELAAQTTG